MKKLLCALALAGALSGCAVPESSVGYSIIKETNEPITATSLRATKTGRACARNLLGIISDGDMSIKAAMKNGGINQVSSVDKEVRYYLIFSRVCTVVRGQ
ncbi:MAG: hypothetical protein EOM53_00900 [Alphaproteobacteria bacterium]|nr:hypothetical protein [Alphaproteobacteria bacterium]